MESKGTKKNSDLNKGDGFCKAPITLRQMMSKGGKRGGAPPKRKARWHGFNLIVGVYTQ